MVSASIQKAFKIIIHYSTSFLKKLTLFYKYNIEYILLIKTSIGICLLYNFLYYQYCIGESEVRKDNDLLLYQNIVANFLISNITIELHKNSNENHLFCSNIQIIPTIGIKKFRLLDQDIFCNTRIIKEKLDDLLPSYISYEIYIDSIQLVSSINTDAELFKIKYYNIDIQGKNLLKVKLSIDTQSSYAEKIKDEIIDKVSYVFYISSFFMLCITTVIIFPFIKRYKKINQDNINLRGEAVKLSIIKNARKNIQFLTNKFHKYYEKNHNIYEAPVNKYITEIPIPLVTVGVSDSKQVFEVEIEKVIVASDFLVKEYSILHSYNIKFTYDIVTGKLKVPFEQELFDQIIIGIVANLLLFMKSNKHNYHIHVIIDNKTILFAHDLFNIDEAMMVEYSKMIFQETLNPYILTFGQITKLLNEVYHINYKVYNEFSKKIIKIDITEENKKKDNIIFFFDRNTL